MDTWMGRNHDPITLHKYLYANADPVTYVDPTGNFSIGQTLSAVNTVATLVSRAQAAYSLYEFSSGEKELTAKDAGMMVLFSVGGSAGFKLLKMFSKGKKSAKQIGQMCGNSFESDTMVWTNSGVKRISELEIGEYVLSYDEHSEKTEFNPIVHLIENNSSYKIVNIKTSSGDEIKSTDNHRIYVKDKKWTSAIKIEVGDFLLGKNGLFKEVVSLNVQEKDVEVYNLTIDKLHNYFVGSTGILVHNVNQNCPIPPVKKGGPSGKVSIKKFLEDAWDKGTFGATKKSVEYHVWKHVTKRGRGLTAVQYTQRAIQAFKQSGAMKAAAKDMSGRDAVKVISKYGTGLFTKKGKIIWFEPRL